MSPSVLEVFVSDAGRYLDRLKGALSPESGPADVDGIRRAARGLHHSAMLAKQESVAHATAALQKTGVEVIAGRRAWSERTVNDVARLVELIEATVQALPEEDSELQEALHAVAEELVGRAEESADDDAVPTDDAGPATGATPSGDAEAELDALSADLEQAVDRLENDPRDREPLKSILRRMRTLRDMGQIAENSPADRALAAVEELILQIADLNATVGPGYLTVFRHARDVLQEMREGREAEAEDQVGDHAVQVGEMKDRVLETARRARQVVWVSELFFGEGPHVVECPPAQAEAGSPERYFVTEARSRMERSVELRKKMLESDAEQMRLAGESLAHTLRHLRERAVAFDHSDFGRVTRRAAAALRAQLVRPPSRIRALASGFGDVFNSLQRYLESEDPEERAAAVEAAESALHVAILGGEPELATEDADFDPDRALQRALALRTRVDERLSQLSSGDADGLRQDLEEIFDLIAYYVSSTGRT